MSAKIILEMTKILRIDLNLTMNTKIHWRTPTEVKKKNEFKYAVDVYDLFHIREYLHIKLPHV